jgi:hypothetical protein
LGAPTTGRPAGGTTHACSTRTVELDKVEVSTLEGRHFTPSQLAPGR